MDHRPCADRQDGFTIIELMVASLVLIVGLLGVLSMLTGSLAKTAQSNQRIGATNLARELVETTRGLDYDNLDVAEAQLQSRGLGTGSPWTIQRRGVTYTIASTTCAFDDPADGYAPSASKPPNPCPNLNLGGADSNGDDFRRVTFTLSWPDAGATRSLTQTTLIVNPTGGLGPRILTITPVTQTIVNNVTTATVRWTTTPAVSLNWETDDGIGEGVIPGTTIFDANWNIGTSGTGSEVLDGAYTMSGQAFDDRGIAGEAKRADIVLNRRQPYAPKLFAGGHDTRINDWVDLEWKLNLERDILGYRVYWAGPDGALGNGNDERVCPSDAGVDSLLDPKTTNCADFSPKPGAQTYYVVAVDRKPNNDLREGDASLLTISAPAARLAAPSNLAVTNFNVLARLSWDAPATGAVAFYRIYRDGTAFADRYDRSSSRTYEDSNPGTTSRKYWVTAVDAEFNESDPVGPVTWTP